MMLLLIRAAKWSEIRWQFSEDEKATLRSVIVNQLLCPQGVELDADRLDAGLREKLVGLTLRSKKNR